MVCGGKDASRHVTVGFDLPVVLERLTERLEVCACLLGAVDVLERFVEGLGAAERLALGILDRIGDDQSVLGVRAANKARQQRSEQVGRCVAITLGVKTDLEGEASPASAEPSPRR